MSDLNSNFYPLDIECPNCHFSQKGFKIQKGKKLKEIECPKCWVVGELVESIRTSTYYDFNNGWDL